MINRSGYSCTSPATLRSFQFVIGPSRKHYALSDNIYQLGDALLSFHIVDFLLVFSA